MHRRRVGRWPVEVLAVRRLYGTKHTDWRIQLGRLINEGGGRDETFRTVFSVQRDLEPLPGCTVPEGLVRLFRRLLLSLATARGLRSGLKEPAKGEG